MRSFFVSAGSVTTICAGLSLFLGAPMHAQTYKVMAYFDGDPSESVPPGVIAQSRGGYLVSTSDMASNGGFGEAFRVTTSGSLAILHQFSLAEPGHPFSGLILGRDGLFYGTAAFGGASSTGSIFKMTPTGVITTLHEFGDGPDLHPAAPPVQSLYGDFYGTTAGDWGNDDPSSNPGSVYKVDSADNYTLLHALALDDGTNPFSPLVQSPTNFWFYGTTRRGGVNGNGTIFRIDSEGDFQVVHNFTGADGGSPVALIQANDGNFYGIASTGGADDKGVIFRMTPSNQVTVLYTFTGGDDGWALGGSLVQGSDGFLYGTAQNGGGENEGTLFRISTSGQNFTVLHSFHLASGLQPITLMQHTNGFFYGYTNAGGPLHGESSTYGVFFRLDMGLPPFVTFLNTYGRVGMTVSLLGDGFTSDSQVSFNGVPATEVSDVENTFMKVVIPHGATSGPITVTTTKGLLTSNKVFVVRP
jgi:uncharacterized repeat protein (TIGR03803 family)